MSHDEMRSATLAAIAESNRWGLVGLHDAGEPRDVLDVFEELAKAGNFNLRVYAMISDDSAAIEHYFQRGPQSALYDDQLWIRSIKLYADGALGSRGAALLDPYADDPKNTGLLKPDARTSARRVDARASQHGFQVATHAIGDRGNRVALDAYEAALKSGARRSDHRFRIEHVQVLDHADVPRFAQLGVIPSMQAVHQTSDMYWAPTRLGLCPYASARTPGGRCSTRASSSPTEATSRSSASTRSIPSMPRYRARTTQLAAGRVVSRAADDPRRGPQVDDHLAGLRRVSRSS